VAEGYLPTDRNHPLRNEWDELEHLWRSLAPADGPEGTRAIDAELTKNGWEPKGPGPAAIGPFAGGA
jgi:hypothetical protein